jgi:hypothetical protein
MADPTPPPIIKEATAHQKFSCSACGGEMHWVGTPFANPNGIGIIQPSVDAQRLRWVIAQTIYQL